MSSSSQHPSTPHRHSSPQRGDMHGNSPPHSAGGGGGSGSSPSRSVVGDMYGTYYASGGPPPGYGSSSGAPYMHGPPNGGGNPGYSGHYSQGPPPPQPSSPSHHHHQQQHHHHGGPPPPPPPGYYSYGPPQYQPHPGGPMPPSSYGGPAGGGGYHHHHPADATSSSGPSYYNPNQGPRVLPGMSASMYNKNSPKNSPDKNQVQKKLDPVMNAKRMEEFEAERLKISAATEQSLHKVKPIQTDFHFFVKAMIDDLRIQAEDEVKKTNQGQLDDFLVNTNLNQRLVHAWENLSKNQRDVYMKQEEADRRRFMDEEEVASRHCATLTARATSPSRKIKDDEEKKEPEHGTPPKRSSLSSSNASSPAHDDDDDDEDEDDEDNHLPVDGSPTKKNKIDTDDIVASATEIASA